MSVLYLAKDDEFTWQFFRVDSDDLVDGGKSCWVNFKEVISEHSDLDILNAAAVIHEGERFQRRVVQRKVKPGTRNINNRIGHCNRYLGSARCPEIMASDDREEKKQMLKEFQKELCELVFKVRKQFKCQGEAPSRWSYVVTDDVLDAAEEVGCEEYFEPIENQRFFGEDLKKIEVDVRTKYPEVAEGVLQVLRKTRTDDHLSMISLTADEQGTLYVTLVDPKGHHLTVEASRFVEMIGSHDQPRRLHVFPPRGHRDLYRLLSTATLKAK